MKKLRFRFFCLIKISLLLIASSANAQVIRIPDGDVNALIAAIELANQTPNVLTTIELAANGHYLTGLPPISGKLKILGNSATLDGSGRLHRALTVSEEFDTSSVPNVMIPNVEVYDLNIEDFRSEGKELYALLVEVTHGQLLLDRVTLTNNFMRPRISGRPPLGWGTMIYNVSHTILRNVTISGNVASSASIVGIAIHNYGLMEIGNSTIVDNSPIQPDGFFPAVETFGEIKIVNTIVANSDTRNCIAFQGGSIISFGHNIDSDGSCAFGQSGDLNVIDPGLADLSVESIPVHHLLHTSPALDAGDDQSCTPIDAQGRIRPSDGDGDGIATCDIGAVEEVQPGSGHPTLIHLDAGGFNGLYYNQANDGHYITVQRLRNNDILVIWNTFDSFGAPAWIYGVGHRLGQTISVEAWLNSNGVLQAGGAPMGQSAERWGVMTLDIDSCQGGSFSYDSTLPGFASGEFELNRLGYVYELGCTNGDVDTAPPPATTPLENGGYNGFYYNRANDGHYVTIQRLRANRILVIWNTFDNSGAPAWIIALGHHEGSTIVGTAYRQTGGVLQNGGAPQGQSAEHWGTFELDISSCQGGVFKYDSILPEFGAGKFELDRLSVAFELGCVP